MPKKEKIVDFEAEYNQSLMLRNDVVAALVTDTEGKMCLVEYNHKTLKPRLVKEWW